MTWLRKQTRIQSHTRYKLVLCRYIFANFAGRDLKHPTRTTTSVLPSAFQTMALVPKPVYTHLCNGTSYVSYFRRQTSSVISWLHTWWQGRNHLIYFGGEMVVVTWCVT